MKYVTRDNLTPRPCPRSTRTISGFDLLPDDEKVAHGWYPVTEIRPDYDQATQHLIGPTVSIVGDHADAVYTVEDIPLVELQQRQVAEIVSAQNAEIQAGCKTSLGFRVRCENSDVTMFAAGIVGMEAAGDDTDTVWDYDRIPHEITAEQYRQLGIEIRNYVMPIRKKTSAKIAAIMAAKTAADVFAVTWEDA